MGGCRCTFRDCIVGTSQYPGMHFFHYPVNNRKRYLRWLNLADKLQFLDTPVSSQKNRTVCARHFRVECFQNYKRDRLVNHKNVDPTLMPLNDDVVLDYANETENGGPELIKMPICTQKHLIPPPGYVLTFTLHDNTIPSKYIKKRNIILARTENSIELPPSSPPPPPSSQLLQLKRNYETKKKSSDQLVKSKKFKILNTEASNEPETYIKLEIDGTNTLVDLVDLAPINFEENNSFNYSKESTPRRDSDSDINDKRQISYLWNGSLNENEYFVPNQDCEDMPQNVQDEEENHMNLEEQLSSRIAQLEDELSKCQVELKNKTSILQKTQLTLKKTNHERKQLQGNYDELDKSNKEMLEAKKNSTEEMLRLQEENKCLRKKCEQFEKEKQKQKESVTTSQATSSFTTESDAMVNCRQSTTTARTLTKAQLFNSVKKYISSSMVALLRMEMFGSTDREWKPDERRVSIDLLQLGESVYKYLSDEWRFRLPALSEVRTWRTDAMNSIDDEDL